ncbi:MAG: hypothetical protein A2V66_01300 [Ignavibacteria bacterium RBG_13_36_8]|nr:MAG: hypothetical protein A2V66_01300 [Ignavibacteria bacterium RBG_13_36_8]
MLGLIYDNKAMFEECDDAYEKAIQIDPNNATVLNNYAYSLAERGIELERALEMSKNAVEQEPENPSFLDTIGWIYFKLEDFVKAKKYIEDAIDHDKNDDALLNHLGDVYLKMGNKEKALEFWKKSLELNKSNEDLKQKIEKGDL